MRIGTCPKLCPWFCGACEVLDRVGPVAYQLAFPSHIKVHNIFHVILLKIYVHGNTHIIDWKMLWVEPKRYFLPQPLCILDRIEKWLRNLVVAQVKV